MKELSGILKWRPSFVSLPSTTLSLLPPPLSSTIQNPQTQSLTAKEKRQMRKEKRENKPVYNWKEDVEDKLLLKPKKRFATWTEELNLDYLSDLGHQWWVVRVSRLSATYTAQVLANALAKTFPHIDFKDMIIDVPVSWVSTNYTGKFLANSLAKNFPDIDFKVYLPSIQVKRTLKNGSISVKPKPIFPGNLFLKCVMDKEMHDFIRECDGIGGFVGSRVGNTKRQINKPRPVAEEDMEAIFRQTKDEQEKADQAFDEEQKVKETFDPAKINIVYTDTKLDSEFKESVIDTGTKKQKRKTSKSLNDKVVKTGATVRVLSGTFAEFHGLVKKVTRKTGKATVGFTLFGKETIADLNISEIVVETR